MLAIRKLELYGESLKERIQGIEHFALLPEISDLESSIKNLKQGDFPVLLIVEPSGDSRGNEDSQRWTWPILLFVLEKFDHSRESTRSRLDKKEKLQALMQEIVMMMLSDKANHEPDQDHIHLMHDLQPSGMHIDPENQFLGCMGYSLLFQLITN